MKSGKKQAFLDIMPYFLCTFFLLVSYIYLYDIALSAEGTPLKAMMFLVVLALFVIAGCLAYLNRVNFTVLMFFVIFIGIIMRVGYMLYTPYYLRQHDVLGAQGHLAYIQTILNTWQLPSSNDWQFYQPPLFHFLGALTCKIAMIFSNDETFIYNAIRIIPGLASCFTLILSYKIFKNLRFSKAAIFISTLIVSVHPAFIYMSASINNDMLSIFFMILTVLYLIKWFYDSSFKNIVIMAVALGLGMMTKLSIVMIAPVIAAVFIYALIKNIKHKTISSLWQQYFVFGAVSIPLGMWYSIRNLILFKQPIGYVIKFAQITELYCGDYSFAQRFLSLPLQDLFTNVFPYVTEDYNIYLYTLKSSLFGEWVFNDYSTQAKLFMIANIILITISLVSMIYVFVAAKDLDKKFAKWLLGFIWLTQIASFIVFNINYPFGCTMDFRYIVMTVITGAGFIGLAYDTIEQKYAYLAKITAAIIILSILLFAFCSVWFYTNI